MEERRVQVSGGIEINPSYDHWREPGRTSLPEKTANQIAWVQRGERRK